MQVVYHFATSFFFCLFDNLRNNKEYQLVLIGLNNIRLLLHAFRVFSGKNNTT